MIRFHNGRVLSFKNGFEITDDEVWTDGSEIIYTGKNLDKKADREIDLNGNLLMPALICIISPKQWLKHLLMPVSEPLCAVR